jgi:hypothetical protein
MMENSEEIEPELEENWFVFDNPDSNLTKSNIVNMEVTSKKLNYIEQCRRSVLSKKL